VENHGHRPPRLGSRRSLNLRIGISRRCDDTRSYAGLVVSLCTENRFSHWINCGRILEGWAEIRQCKVDQGIELLRAGMASWQKAGARLWLPIFLTLEAEACVETGRGDAALEFIEEALAVSKDTGERWAMAEVLRVKARLLQILGRTETREIEELSRSLGGRPLNRMQESVSRAMAVSYASSHSFGQMTFAIPRAF
jgi:predicted ATPase